MFKFKICIQRYVEEIAVVEFDGDDVDDARQKAMDFVRHDPEAKVDWNPGDDIDRLEVYAVLDDKGNTVWER